MFKEIMKSGLLEMEKNGSMSNNVGDNLNQ